MPAVRKGRSMKRLLILFCLLVLSASALPAQGMAIAVLGAWTGYASQDTAAGNPWNASSGGIFMSGHTYWPGSPFVMYWAAMFGGVLDSKDNGNAIDLGQYRALVFPFPTNIDVLWGFGYRLPLGNPWTAVLAAGFYMGGTAFLPKPPPTKVGGFALVG